MFYLTSKATRFLDPPHVCHLGIQSVLFSKTENEAQPEERMAQPESPLGSTHSSLCPSPSYTMLESIAKQCFISLFLIIA